MSVCPGLSSAGAEAAEPTPTAHTAAALPKGLPQPSTRPQHRFQLFPHHTTPASPFLLKTSTELPCQQQISCTRAHPGQATTGDNPRGSRDLTAHAQQVPVATPHPGGLEELNSIPSAPADPSPSLQAWLWCESVLTGIFLEICCCFPKQAACLSFPRKAEAEYRFKNTLHFLLSRCIMVCGLEKNN